LLADIRRNKPEQHQQAEAAEIRNQAGKGPSRLDKLQREAYGRLTVCFFQLSIFGITGRIGFEGGL